MKSGNLSSRLTALKSVKASDKAGKAIKRDIERKNPSVEMQSFPGWKKIAPFVYEKTTIFPGEKIIEESRELLDIYGITNNERQIREPVSRMQFFDLETTGLSGGAGNIAFLAGIGRIIRGDFHLIQYFLQDYPGEFDFLTAVSRILTADGIWVSYNGKSFDTALLRTRFLLNGIPFKPGLNLDLLYPARRLWKNLLVNCSLGTVEESILKKTRSMDIPGRMIPDIFFKYLKTGRAKEMENVFAHHSEDILSLLHLYNILEKILSFSDSVTAYPRDNAGFALLLRSRRPEKYVEVLIKGTNEGNIRCAYLLGEYYKRQTEWNAAFAVWKGLWDNHDYRAGIELAMEWEHRRKEYSRALAIVEILIEKLDPVETRKYEELTLRKKRLMFKLNR